VPEGLGSSRGECDAPRFEVDPFWPKPLQTLVTADYRPSRWMPGKRVEPSTGPTPLRINSRRGPKVGTCCKVAPPILHTTQAGNLINSWAPGPATTGRIATTGLLFDHKVMSGLPETDQGTPRFKFTSTGKFLMQLGKHGVHNEATTLRIFGRPAKIFDDPTANEVYNFHWIPDVDDGERS